MSKIKWSYGVLTVPQRRDNLLPVTLASLEEAGFNNPTLFVDNCELSDIDSYATRHYPLVFRISPGVLAFGNWFLALWELYLKNPASQFFALFEDDILVCSNLRQYLEQSEYPKSGYWNLYTAMENESLVEGKEGWALSNQLGRGALALVFDKTAVMKILAANHIVNRVQNTSRGCKGIDGAVSDAMKQSHYKEYVHNPSLVQHMGIETTIKRPRYISNNPSFKPSSLFRGKDFDVLELLKRREANNV